MRRLKIIGFFLVTSGTLTILVCAVLPLVKLPQTFVKEGPSAKLDGNVTYWIDTWVLPPIDAGTPLFLNLEAASPGGISIAILPSSSGNAIPDAAPLLSYVFNPAQQKFSISTVVSTSSEYIVFIVCIKNNFTLTINSTWSPFYNFRIYLYFGIATLPAGLLIIYYNGILENKERQIREAIQNSSRQNMRKAI